MDFLKTTVDELTVKLGLTMSIGNHPPLNEEKNTPSPPTNIYHPFRLPIEYLEHDKKHKLSPIVVDDLELAESGQIPIYDLLFQPTHEFSKNIIQEWKRTFTTDVEYLKETQAVVEQMAELRGTPETAPATTPATTPVDANRLLSIWKDVREDPHFLEKYSYMEFDFLKHLNHSQTFLQTITVGNIISPLVSLFIPIIFFILPFVILKFRGEQIQFSTYTHILKDLAKHHFIGKTLKSLETFDWNKIGYIAVTIGMYFLQIYNNITACIRFVRNMSKVNGELLYLREYLAHSSATMGGFVELHNSKPTYHAFCEDIQKQRNVLNRLETELATITPFTFSFSKLNQTGYMLKCYYQLYSNEEYGEALRFSFGFEGYINNMLGVFNNWKKGNVSPASFKNSKTKGNAGVPSSSNQLYIKEQYYPSHDKELAVKNSIKMGVQKTQKSKTKGMVITGPNASGKTTLLKTTAINIILTQQLGMGYYTKCTLPPFKYIHSYLNIPDTSGRDSLFQAESRRCKDILDSIHTGDKEDRHFCIFDELYSGTNPVEASKASFAFLKYLSGFENVVFVLTTHYTCVCKKIIKNGISSIVNRKMAVERNPADENELIYTYKLEKGISSVEGAITILKSLNYPDEIMRDFV